MSDERVPVGSTWKWKGGNGRKFTVIDARGGALSLRYDNDTVVSAPASSLHDATCIDTCIDVLGNCDVVWDTALPEPEIRYQKLTYPGDLRVLAIPPGPARAEEPAATREPKCKPGCTPAAPCRTVGACPIWREEMAGYSMHMDGLSLGIFPDWPPPAKRRAPPELRSAGLCIAGWNGREGLR